MSKPIIKFTMNEVLTALAEYTKNLTDENKALKERLSRMAEELRESRRDSWTRMLKENEDSDYIKELENELGRRKRFLGEMGLFDEYQAKRREWLIEQYGFADSPEK